MDRESHTSASSPTDPTQPPGNEQHGGRAGATARPALHGHVFPDAGRKMFEAVLERIRWHHEEIGMSLGAVNSDLKDRLTEIANDARYIWALAELLCKAAETAR